MNHKLKNNDNHSLFKIKWPQELKKLLSTGTDINMLTSSGQNALFHCKYPELMKEMINAGININKTDTSGKNAIFYTLCSETLNILTENGIDINHTDIMGRNSLFYNRDAESVRLLVKNGININHTDHEGKNALFCATSESSARELLDSGIDINHTDNEGGNALFYAFNPDVARLLIQRGINVNHRNMYNNNAINISYINYTNTDLLNLFFAAGLDPDIQDYYGNSLLFYSNTKATSDILINNGCDINHVNNNGETVFEYIQTMLFSNSQLDERLSALTPYVHLIKTSPLIFNRLTYGCLELIKILKSRNIDYKISQRCVVRYPNKEIKKFITEVQKIIDISNITLCSWYDTPLVSLKNKEIIKWFIRNNVRVNVNDIEEENIRTEILSYIASREKKEIRQLLDTTKSSPSIKKRL
ncbi:ankyrin repeat domain-containing protein [Citrobacter meridianamericanus]|uniref:ankyrin repeat domain-containing protein n=1 Tax=Citrobacter meridianamericanus TaxID=2894201 RepID=UPI0039BDC756